MNETEVTFVLFALSTALTWTTCTPSSNPATYTGVFDQIRELFPLIQTLEEEMHDAARDLRFEYAARLRDEVNDLRKELKALKRGGM